MVRCDHCRHSKRHSQTKFYPPPGWDREQDKESTILVDVENDELDVGNEVEKDVADTDAIGTLL